MSVVAQRTVAELVRRAHSGPPRRFIGWVMVVGVLVAAINGASAARTLGERATVLRQQDHLVTAALTHVSAPVAGRVAVRTAVETWTYPAGRSQHRTTSVPLASRSTRASLWVDPAGHPVSGPASAPEIFGTAALTGLQTLVLAALLLGVALAAQSAWRWHRVRVAVDSVWLDLVHELWEGL
jgi:hypothetical protein